MGVYKINIPKGETRTKKFFGFPEITIEGGKIQEVPDEIAEAWNSRVGYDKETKERHPMIFLPVKMKPVEDKDVDIVPTDIPAKTEADRLESLLDMKMREIRSICKNYSIPAEVGKTKQELAEAIVKYEAENE